MFYENFEARKSSKCACTWTRWKLSERLKWPDAYYSGTNYFMTIQKGDRLQTQLMLKDQNMHATHEIAKQKISTSGINWLPNV